MADNETTADIIAWLRKPREGENAYLTLWRDEIADRLEAAHKRERGDAAKLREALDESRRIASDLGGCRLNDYWKLNEIVRVCESALAAPARNCDMPLVVDGPADNNADKAWIVFKRHNPDAYFDVPGLLRCIDWLLAPATEKEGGAK